MSPWVFILILLAVLAIATLVGVIRGQARPSAQYLYKKKRFFLSAAEHRFYDALVAAVGQQYYVFAQVHLPTIVDHKIPGQSWRGAFRHIDEKSVDFVLCDKAYISPKLAIELDDSSHQHPDRQERDREVERILRAAGLQLLRWQVGQPFDQSTLTHKISQVLAASP